MTIQPRPGILEVAPYIGGESKAAGVNRVIRLASNENPLGPGPLSVAAYEAEKTQLHRYRSEEHTSELQSLMCISYAVFCLKKNTTSNRNLNKTTTPNKTQ